MTTCPLILPDTGVFVLRIWQPETAGPALCTLRNGHLFDITTPDCPTRRGLLSTCELEIEVAGDPGQRNFN